MTSSANRKYITYLNATGSGPSQGLRQRAQNLVKSVRAVVEIITVNSRQTDCCGEVIEEVPTTVMLRVLFIDTSEHIRFYCFSVVGSVR